jgi:hypothetical protein
LPQIGASSLKLERKPSPHWKHLRLYMFPFGFQLLNMLIILLFYPILFIFEPHLGHEACLCCVPQFIQ